MGAGNQADAEPASANAEEEGGDEDDDGDSCVEDETKGDEFSFPDTTISLPHLQPNRAALNHDLKRETTPQAEADSQGKKHMSAKQRREEKKKKQKQEGCDSEEKTEISNLDQGAKCGGGPSQPPLKRGQKNKLKKIKEKYKDQDEEDRELMMQLLGSAGSKEEKDKAKKGKKGKGKEEPVRKPQQKPRDVATEARKPERQRVDDEEEAAGEQQEDKEDEADQDNPGAEEAENLLTSLSGQPHPEDVLLFAVPVCAPYTALSNYKHKVKLTPGSQKKGKAARTALLSFIKAKDATSREKDLFRSVKDADLSRNMPGKVKVSAPNLLAAKKK